MNNNPVNEASINMGHIRLLAAILEQPAEVVLAAILAQLNPRSEKNQIQRHKLTATPIEAFI